MRRVAWNLSEEERKFLYQKAKCRYFINSDRTTKFFHFIVKKNLKKNHILVLMKNDGTITRSEEEVVEEFLVHYQGLLGTNMEVVNIDVVSSNMAQGYLVIAWKSWSMKSQMRR